MQNLLFNNFVCEAYGSNSNSSNGSAVEDTQYQAFVGTAAHTTSIYLEYTPITYVNLPVNLNPFTQFLVRWVTATQLPVQIIYKCVCVYVCVCTAMRCIQLLCIRHNVVYKRLF